MDVLEAIGSLRATRRFLQKPVEEEKLRIILEAATKAPSAGNRQPWEFIVIRDRATKAKLKPIIERGWKGVLSAVRGIRGKERRVYDEATKLVKRTDEVPMLILVCSSPERSAGRPDAQHHSIYPAVQNVLLAAHSLGLGACLTTHLCSPARGEEEAKRLLGIPKESRLYALIYLGYPEKRLKPPTRIPFDRLTHYERW